MQAVLDLGRRNMSDGSTTKTLGSGTVSRGKGLDLA
jgi:hypothetical protein